MLLTVADQSTDEVRPAVPEDAAELARLDELSRDGDVAIDRYAAFCARTGNNRALVFAHRGQARGFLAYSWVLDEATLFHLAVEPTNQRRGIGRKLLDAALRDMRARGLCRCLLEVRESNVAARQLYRSAGFELDGSRPDYYPAGQGREDALLLSLVF